jgi:hypothetical protein
MVIQQQASSLFVSVSFCEEKKKIIEVLLRQCVSQCVFDEGLKDWRGFSDRVCRVFPERKRPLERSRCRWEDNIKMDLQEVGGGVVGTGWS